jgi:nitrate reductase gamma subunit
MYGFVEGPLVWIAGLIFALGLLFQGVQFFRLTAEKKWLYPSLPPETKKKKRTLDQLAACCLVPLKGTLWKTDPLMTVITSIFHVCLIVTPLFLLGHSILLDQALGLSLWSFPEWMTDGLTLVILICAAFLLGRRLFLARVRIITTAYDYLTLLIAIAPFLTGYLAYHQWFDYPTVMTLHVLSGEAMLITLPFTKLGHMLFFFLYRFLIGSEYSFARGTRTW